MSANPETIENPMYSTISSALKQIPASLSSFFKD